jgi:hypothetical protein
MAEKVVDVFLKERLVASYPVIFDSAPCRDFGAGILRASQARGRLCRRGHCLSEVQRQKRSTMTLRHREWQGAGDAGAVWRGQALIIIELH